MECQSALHEWHFHDYIAFEREHEHNGEEPDDQSHRANLGRNYVDFSQKMCNNSVSLPVTIPEKLIFY